jgi:hypothetical protein
VTVRGTSPVDSVMQYVRVVTGASVTVESQVKLSIRVGLQNEPKYTSEVPKPHSSPSKHSHL